jgi:uncharacterized membrane protein YkvI
MVRMFVKLAYFFRAKKEERMTKFQRHKSSCRHGTIIFMSNFFALLSVVDRIISFAVPLDKILNNVDNRLSFRFVIIWDFLIRGELDFFVSLGLLYLFYCLGMQRLNKKNAPN